MNGIKLQCGLDEPMVSVMAIGSEVFGSCVGGIDVSVEVEYGDDWLCCGWSSFLIYLGVKSGSRLCA